MKRLPTDLQILNLIYKCYYGYYREFTVENPNRKTKNFVPIDITKIAKELGVDEDIIFGRLYYNLDRKYSYTREGSSPVRFFLNSMDDELHCVNFPYLASVLAALRDESQRYLVATSVSVISLIISLISLYVSMSK
jgi:hypothetical protein